MSAGRLVYLVDDDKSVHRAMARLLRSAGIEMRGFRSAAEFLAADLPDTPACLVLDLRMPGLNGLELQDELRRLGGSLPIVFITGHGEVSESVRAMKSGALDFLEKPFSDQELLDAIDRALALDGERRAGTAAMAQLRACYETLTPREREVFALVVAGLLNKQVGAELGASEKTIKVHRARVMQKMGVRSLAELVRVAEKLGIPDTARKHDGNV